MRPRLQLAFLTGQSDPGRCALSPAQAAFLDAVTAPRPEVRKVALNFPYDPATAPYRPVPLWRGSLANARQVLAACRPAFARRHAAALAALLAEAERTVLLAGSCGLALIARLAPALPEEALARVEVVAYGPVARRRPPVPCLVVQGRRDWLSRACFGARQVDLSIPGGHLGYLARPELLALVQGRVDRLLREAA